MSVVNISLIDEQQAICGEVHGSNAERLVASLSDEPTTIEELKTALARFKKTNGASELDLFHEGINEEPYDAGVVIIDLRHRVVASEQNYFSLTRQGKVSYHDGQATERLIPYRLSENWKLVNSINEWKALKVL